MRKVVHMRKLPGESIQNNSRLPLLAKLERPFPVFVDCIISGVIHQDDENTHRHTPLRRRPQRDFGRCTFPNAPLGLMVTLPARSSLRTPLLWDEVRTIPTSAPICRLQPKIGPCSHRRTAKARTFNTSAFHQLHVSDALSIVISITRQKLSRWHPTDMIEWLTLKVMRTL